MGRFYFSSDTNFRELFIAWVSTIRCESGRGESAVPCSTVKTKARAVVGRGEEDLHSDPGSELRLHTDMYTEGEEKEKIAKTDKKRD